MSCSYLQRDRWAGWLGLGWSAPSQKYCSSKLVSSTFLSHKQPATIQTSQPNRPYSTRTHALRQPCDVAASRPRGRPNGVGFLLLCCEVTSPYCKVAGFSFHVLRTACVEGASVVVHCLWELKEIEDKARAVARDVHAVADRWRFPGRGVRSDRSGRRERRRA